MPSFGSCKICSHPEGNEINLALRENDALQDKGHPILPIADGTPEPPLNCLRLLGFAMAELDPDRCYLFPGDQFANTEQTAHASLGDLPLILDQGIDYACEECGFPAIDFKIDLPALAQDSEVTLKMSQRIAKRG